jgi:CRISPR-associated RAMP protein (TIGR02581 family)
VINPPTLERRYLFTGVLALQTALHVGGSWTAGSPSDSPVIRTPEGLPFIPGSSFKGAFRSTVEKLALAAGLSSCALLEGQGCIGAQGKEQKDFNEWRRDHNDDDANYLGQLNQKLCDTCKLFGSSFAASRIYFADLLPPEDDRLASSMIQVRDGVAIDRDSEKAVDQLKYDYEVVAAAQTFQVSIRLEGPSANDLALTCLGLKEFASGFGHIGGKRSRGLGVCRIDGLTIYAFDLTDANAEERGRRLQKYLLGKTPAEKMTIVSDPQTFLDTKIRTLPIFQEGHHA